MGYKRTKHPNCMSWQHLIREINNGDISQPPKYDNAFKQLVFDDKNARQDFLEIASFVDKHFSKDNYMIHIGGTTAISIASFLALSRSANDIKDYLLDGVFSASLGLGSAICIDAIKSLKTLAKDNILQSLVDATLNREPYTMSEYVNLTQFKHDEDWRCAKTIMFHALDNEFVKILENINEKDSEMSL